MKAAVKFVPVVVCLAASLSIYAQERTVAQAKPSSKKMMVIDPKVRDQMMTTTDEMDKQVKDLKSRLDRERAAMNSGRPPSVADQAAADAQIRALQKSIQELREQADKGPHYLDQNDSLLP